MTVASFARVVAPVAVLGALVALPGRASAADPPPTADAAQTKAGDEGYPIRFEPNAPDVALMVPDGVTTKEHERWFRSVIYTSYRVTTAYAPVCRGACDLALDAGSYRFALASGDGDAVPVPSPVVIAGPSRLRAELEDHHAARRAGAIVGLGGAIVGFGIAIPASIGGHEAFGAAGLAITVTSIVVGAALATRKDAARIVVTPLDVAWLGDGRERGAARESGGAIGVRF